MHWYSGTVLVWSVGCQSLPWPGLSTWPHLFSQWKAARPHVCSMIDGPVPLARGENHSGVLCVCQCPCVQKNIPPCQANPTLSNQLCPCDPMHWYSGTVLVWSVCFPDSLDLAWVLGPICSLSERQLDPMSVQWLMGLFPLQGEKTTVEFCVFVSVPVFRKTFHPAKPTQPSPINCAPVTPCTGIQVQFWFGLCVSQTPLTWPEYLALSVLSVKGS